MLEYCRQVGGTSGRGVVSRKAGSRRGKVSAKKLDLQKAGSKEMWVLSRQGKLGGVPDEEARLV